jgi:hypothetical protein
MQAGIHAEDSYSNDKIVSLIAIIKFSNGVGPYCSPVGPIIPVGSFLIVLL